MNRAKIEWVLRFRRHTYAALLAAAVGCGVAGSGGSGAGAGPNAGASGDDAGGASVLDTGAPPPALGGGTCTQAPAPAGTACACHYTACHDCAIECDCSADCYETARTDCLITVDASGVPHTSDPVLATGTLTCRLDPAMMGEIPKPAQMVCTETSCMAPAPPSAPPSPPASSPDGGGACPVPVPGAVVLPGPVWGDYQVHFEVPFPNYAFAAAHASLAMETVAPIGLRESPSAFFATALKESYLGCSDKLPALDLYNPGHLYTRTASYAAGCLQIDSTSAWVQMCQMYPETIDATKVAYADVIPSTNQDTAGRDNFASSVFVKAYYDTWAYAMLTTHHMPSPQTWFAGASDPEALVKVLALLYNEGGWTGDATAVADGCQQNLIESCLGNKDYVVSVGAYTAQLEATVAAGNCYNEMVAIGDVDDYVSRITPLFAGENGAALTAAGRSAFLGASGGATSAPFQVVAGAVIRAIDGAMQAKVHCPDAELNQYYMFHCPM